MTARVKRQAVLIVTWIVVTTSATVMAWWSVTLVTAEVADRRPLRPSDVVAASARQAVPVPSWAFGTGAVLVPSSASPNPPPTPVGGGNSADFATIRTAGTAQVAASAPRAAHPAARPVDTNLVAGWSPTPVAKAPSAPGVSRATDVAVTVGTTVAVSQAPAIKGSTVVVRAVEAIVASTVAPAVTVQTPVVRAAAVPVAVTSPAAPAAAVQPTVKALATSPVTVQPEAKASAPASTWWASHRSPVPASAPTPTATPTPAPTGWAPSRHWCYAVPVATPKSPEPAPSGGTEATVAPASAPWAGRYAGAA